MHGSIISLLSIPFVNDCINVFIITLPAHKTTEQLLLLTTITANRTQEFHICVIHLEVPRESAMQVLLARYCYRKSFDCLSVRLSVRLSVTLMYPRHIGWTSSKLIP